MREQNFRSCQKLTCFILQKEHKRGVPQTDQISKLGKFTCQLGLGGNSYCGVLYNYNFMSPIVCILLFIWDDVIYMNYFWDNSDL